MNRDEFIALLSRLVVDGEITEAEAAELLRQFDDGTLPDTWQLPQAVDEGIRGHDDGYEEEAAAILLALLLLYNQDRLVRFPQQTIYMLADAVQNKFIADGYRLAEQLANGNVPLAVWQSQQLALIEQHVIEQMFLGNGRAAITATQRRALDNIVQEQSAYLQRFADELAYTLGTTGALNSGAVGNRAALYGGVARAAFFEAHEATHAGDRGWVVYYRARDDKSTCSPCRYAQGYYRVSEGPMPGSICRGGGHCRCRRELVYNMAEYNRLNS